MLIGLGLMGDGGRPARIANGGKGVSKHTQAHHKLGPRGARAHTYRQEGNGEG